MVGRKRILCDLDKAFYNVKWLEKYDGWSYKVGVRGTSDYGALMGGVTTFTRPSNIPFRYQAVWTTHPTFIKVIQDSWNEEIFGNPAFCFTSKLKRLKNWLMIWNWEVFGDIKAKVKTTEDNVIAASLESDADPENIVLLNNLIIARGKHDLASQQYNELMRGKARVKCVKEGGANTAFFHTTMKIRKSYNNIFEIEDEAGNIVTSQDQISDVLVTHYKKKFERRNVVFEEDLFEAIPKILTEDDNIFLDAVPSQEEIKKVVFGMNANNTPGPDGFPGLFIDFLGM
ncbi:uncharacterized protein LOC113312252 [Papaver somniferum]|uniref:uncharacterized protein LOC113312252 n=1 Tax=Papaver somniferum TaxID=3469 RepID=UPI000E6F8827|nr:uncharacterized protein LOC113312252 [Papaver somniferum]